MDPKEALNLYFTEKLNDFKGFLFDLVPHDAKSMINMVLLSVCTTLIWYGLLLMREEYLFRKGHKRKVE